MSSHRDPRGQEPADKHYTGQPERLTADEQRLFDDLRADRLGERVRLEPKRVGFGALRGALPRTLEGTPPGQKEGATG